MNEASKTSIQVGPGLLGCLTIVFVIAKLTGHLDWSWWWVFEPLWLPWVVLLGVGAIGLILYGALSLFVAVLDWAAKAKRRRLPRRMP
jgi:hypothetical protein